MNWFPFARRGTASRGVNTRTIRPWLGAVAALLAATGLHAATVTWTGAGGDSFIGRPTELIPGRRRFIVQA